MALRRLLVALTKLKAITDTRTGLLAGLIGLGALLTFWLNSRVSRITAETLRVTEQGQITERYTKAIEQLGSRNVEVRLGGIYALERIARDSAEDGATIAEVLTAFIRGRARGLRSHQISPPRTRRSMRSASCAIERPMYRRR